MDQSMLFAFITPVIVFDLHFLKSMLMKLCVLISEYTHHYRLLRVSLHESTV